MCEVYVPKYRLIQDAKPHYVYTIEVLGSSIQQTIEKRYSAFHALHREVSWINVVLLDWGGWYIIALYMYYNIPNTRRRPIISAGHSYLTRLLSEQKQILYR